MFGDFAFYPRHHHPGGPEHPHPGEPLVEQGRRHPIGDLNTLEWSGPSLSVLPPRQGLGWWNTVLVSVNGYEGRAEFAVPGAGNRCHRTGDDGWLLQFGKFICFPGREQVEAEKRAGYRMEQGEKDFQFSWGEGSYEVLEAA